MKGASLRLSLEGLNCASCAAKIEAGVRKLPGVADASLDILDGSLVIRLADGAKGDGLAVVVQSLVSSIEPGVVVRDRRESAVAGFVFPKRDALRLAAAGLLLAAALLLPVGSGLQTALFVAAYLTAGVHVLRTVAVNLARGRVFDEFFLMTIATLGAFAVGEYAEAVAVMLFYEAGELVQDMAVARSRRAILSLSDIRPDGATVLEGGVGVPRRAEDVPVGSLLLVKPGEGIPLDGVVTEGATALDTASLTGESIPRDVRPGDEVLAGSVNLSGTVVVRTASLFGESTLSKALRLMEESREKKAPTERFITSFARWYTPAVVAAAVLLAILPPLAGFGTVRQWGYRALVFLVVSCPCALVISVPLAVFGGIGAASKRGVFLKGGGVLENLWRTKGVLFDKTGTLTKGVFDVTEVVPHGAFTSDELLRAAAAAESGSNHPIARAVAAAGGGATEPVPVEETAGMGVRAVVDGQIVLAGNARLLGDAGIAVAPVEASGAPVHVAVGGRYAGYLVVSDTLRTEAARAVQSLRALGVTTIGMLSGDRAGNAEAVASSLALDVWEGDLLPGDKLRSFERERGRIGGVTVFVGDGLNDAPLLAAADVGLAMGGLGADAAVEAADGVLLGDDPSSVADVVAIARRTRAIVWQNIGFALGVKGAVLLLGAWGMATMWEAVFADVGVALLATLNSSRVLMGK